MKNPILLALCLSLFLLAGCEIAPTKPSLITSEKYIEMTYAASDHLISQLRARGVYKDNSEPILVATLVNLDELESSSRLGRSISEQVASRLTQQGFKVIEVKLRGTLYVKKSEGEMLLSREVANIGKSYKAPAVIVGTYAPATNFVAINLKVVSAESQLAIAATDYGLPLDENIRRLLLSGRHLLPPINPSPISP